MPKGKNKGGGRSQQTKNSRKEQKKSKSPTQRAQENANADEKKIKDALISLYHYGLLNLQIKGYLDAFRAFDAITPLASADPLVWMRKAEAVLANANRKEQIVAAMPNSQGKYTPQSYTKTVHESTSDSQAVRQMRTKLESLKLDPDEFLNVNYAEICLRTSLALLKGAKHNVYEEKFIMASYAFLQLRFGFYHRAKIYCVQCMTFPIDFDRSVMPARYFHFVDSMMMAIIFKELVFSPIMEFMDQFILYPIPPDTGIVESINTIKEIVILIRDKNYESAMEKYKELFKVDFTRELMALGVYLYMKVDKLNTLRDEIICRYPEIDPTKIEVPSPVQNGFASEVGFQDYWARAIEGHLPDMIMRMNEAKMYLQEKVVQESEEEKRQKEEDSSDEGEEASLMSDESSAQKTAERESLDKKVDEPASSSAQKSKGTMFDIEKLEALAGLLQPLPEMKKGEEPSSSKKLRAFEAFDDVDLEGDMNDLKLDEQSAKDKGLNTTKNIKQ